MFRRHRKHSGMPPGAVVSAGGSVAESEHYTISYDMMMKGADVLRRGRKVRQFAVMVGGTMHLVTSGDTVDRDTYRALVAAGAVAVPAAAPAPPSGDAAPAPPEE